VFFVRNFAFALPSVFAYVFENGVAVIWVESLLTSTCAGLSKVLTTRQKLMAKEGFGSSTAPADLVARPLKMERNVLGQVFRSQRDEGE